MYTLHTSTSPHTLIWNSVVIIIWYTGVPFNPDATSQCCPLFVRTSRLVHVWHAWFPSSLCSNVCRSGLTADDFQQANKSQELQPRCLLHCTAPAVNCSTLLVTVDSTALFEWTQSFHIECALNNSETSKKDHSAVTNLRSSHNESIIFTWHLHFYRKTAQKSFEHRKPQVR